MNELQIQTAGTAYADLDRVCNQLKAAMKRCPELAEILRRVAMTEAPQLIGLDFESLDNKISVRPVVSSRLRAIADAATRLADWDPCSPSGLQKSEALRLLTDLIAPKGSASRAEQIDRVVARSERYY